MTTALEAIKRGGRYLAQQPTRIRRLEIENAKLKKEVEYWASVADQNLMECNRFERAYRITRRRLHRKQRQLNNSKPSSKTVGQAQADHDLQQRGL